MPKSLNEQNKVYPYPFLNDIRDKRIEKGYSIKELAKMIDVRSDFLSKVLMGKSHFPSKERMNKLLDILEIKNNKEDIFSTIKEINQVFRNNPKGINLDLVGLSKEIDDVLFNANNSRDAIVYYDPEMEKYASKSETWISVLLDRIYKINEKLKRMIKALGQSTESQQQKDCTDES